MLLTDRFVYIHMPKTGGTFVTSVLERLHALPKRTFPLSLYDKTCRTLGVRVRPNLRYGALENLEPKHATCHEIPATQQSKPIVSCMRSPHEWYVSQYEFSWWKRTDLYDPGAPPTPAGYAIEEVLPRFRASHPHFPEISFAEFIELCELASAVYDANRKFGLYTHGFTRYFFRDPGRAISEFSPEYFAQNKQHDMFNVHFLYTESLNRDLRSFLVQHGYRREDLAFLSGLRKILPDGRGRRDDQHWSDYYTPELEQRVRAKDWPLYRLFPQYLN